MIYLCLALLALFGLPFLFSSAIGIFVQMTIGLSMMRRPYPHLWAVVKLSIPRSALMAPGRFLA